jgi:hypothetical protein
MQEHKAISVKVNVIKRVRYTHGSNVIQSVRGKSDNLIQLLKFQ